MVGCRFQGRLSHSTSSAKCCSRPRIVLFGSLKTDIFGADPKYHTVISLVLTPPVMSLWSIPLRHQDTVYSHSKTEKKSLKPHLNLHFALIVDHFCLEPSSAQG